MAKASTSQKCVDCGKAYDEEKGEFHPPSECPARNPQLKAVEKKKETKEGEE